MHLLCIFLTQISQLFTIKLTALLAINDNRTGVKLTIGATLRESVDKDWVRQYTPDTVWTEVSTTSNLDDDNDDDFDGIRVHAPDSLNWMSLQLLTSFSISVNSLQHTDTDTDYIVITMKCFSNDNLHLSSWADSIFLYIQFNCW